MSYRINASSSAGAVSISVVTLDQAWAKVDELAAKGCANLVILDAGTGEPVRRKQAGKTPLMH